MGRGKSKEEAETLLSPPEDVPDDGYVWPDNLYEEIMEMGVSTVQHERNKNIDPTCCTGFHMFLTCSNVVVSLY